MTTEELEIVVQTNIEQVVTEFKKIVPQIKKIVKQIEDSINNIDINVIANKVQQAVQQLKQKMGELKKNISSAGGTFKNVANIAGKVKSGFSQIFNVTGKIVNKIKQMGTGFKQGIGHILSYAKNLLSLQTIYSKLSDLANSWLSSQNDNAQQLSANIEYLKNAMGSALAPAIQFITDLTYKLIKAIQSVAYTFTGVNIFANAGANVENDSIKSNFDLSEIDKQINPLSQKLYDFFKPLVDSWNNFGEKIMGTLKNTFEGIFYSIESMWQSVEKIITNGTMYSILSNILNFIGEIGQAWSNAWTNNDNGTNIIQEISNIIEDITQSIFNLVSSSGFQSFLDGILSTISGIAQFLEPIVSGFSEMADVILEIVMTTIGDLLTTIGNAIQSIAQNETASMILEAIGSAIAIIVTAILLWNTAQLILNGLIGLFKLITIPINLVILGIVAAISAIILIIQNWGAISEWFGDLWTSITITLQEVWNGIKDFFINLWQVIYDTAISVWNQIKDFFISMWTAIASFFDDIWNGIKNVVMTVWNAITSIISNVINVIKNTISNVLNTIKTIWSNIWDGIKNTVVSIWNGIWSAIKTVINLILGGIESFVNGVIKGINWVLGGISNLANAVGSFIGLDPINLRINTISLPRLAKGAVLKVPTIAEMAEYPGARTNPEIVTPQNIMEETFDRVLAKYQNEENTPIYLTVNVGNAKLGQILLDDLRSMKRISGKGIEALVN